MAKYLKRSRVECWPLGDAFPGRGGFYQRVAVLKTNWPRLRLAPNGTGVPPATRAHRERTTNHSITRPLAHVLTVKVENIMEAA